MPREEGEALPRLLLWLALCGLWRGAAALPSRGAALPSLGAALPSGRGTAAACSPRCQHGGLCLGNGTCLCSKGYEGELCQHGNCPASLRWKGGGGVLRAGSGCEAMEGKGEEGPARRAQQGVPAPASLPAAAAASSVWCFPGQASRPERS